MTVQIVQYVQYIDASLCRRVLGAVFPVRRLNGGRTTAWVPAPSLSQPNFSSTSGGCVRASCAAILLATLAPTQLRRRLIANLALPTLPSLRQLPLRALLLLA
jgi:hypothetical protein